MRRILDMGSACRHPGGVHDWHAGPNHRSGLELSRAGVEPVAACDLPTLLVVEGGYAVDALGVNTGNVLQGFERD